MADREIVHLPPPIKGLTYAVCYKQAVVMGRAEAGPPDACQRAGPEARERKVHELVKRLRRLGPDVQQLPHWVQVPVNFATYNLRSMSGLPQFIEDALFSLFSRWVLRRGPGQMKPSVGGSEVVCICWVVGRDRGGIASMYGALACDPKCRRAAAAMHAY